MGEQWRNIKQGNNKLHEFLDDIRMVFFSLLGFFIEDFVQYQYPVFFPAKK